jgi:hypothetical protein
MDGVGGKTDNHQLQLAIDTSAAGAVGSEVEAWCKEVVRAILMCNIKDCAFDLCSRKSPEIVATNVGGELVCVSFIIGQILCVLQKLDIVFTAENGAGCWRACQGCCKVGIVQFQLYTDKLNPSAATIIPLAILDGLENGEIRSIRRIDDGVSFSVMPQENFEVVEVPPVAQQLPLPIS